MIFMASLKISDQISKHFLQCTTSILQLASTPLENKNNIVRELHEPNSRLFNNIHIELVRQPYRTQVYNSVINFLLTSSPLTEQ